MIVADFIVPLMDAYVLNWHRVEDDKRNLAALAQSLVSPGNWWSRAQEDWIWFRRGGLVTILGNESSVDIRARLKAQLDISDIKRLTAIVPEPVEEYKRFLKEIGFKQEGVLKQAISYNGTCEDAYIMGFLARNKTGRRRSRRV